MVERLVNLLKKEAEGNKWLMNYSQIDSKELFFIKDKLDMNRAKSVEHCSVTLYKEIEEDGKKYIGSAVFKAAPGMSDGEMTKRIKDGLYSASLAKNPDYSLVKPTGETLPELSSNIDFEKSDEVLNKVIDLVYSIDKEHEASVNSMEIFLQQVKTRVVNSEGIDETFALPHLIIELVTDIKGEKEEVELYDMIKVSAFDEKLLKEKISGDFENVEKRGKAQKLSLEKDIPIILKGEAVTEIFSYYIGKANALAIYKKYSQFSIGDNVQGADAKGDKVSISLMPEIPNSIDSKYVDADGVILKEIPLYKDGKLLALHGDNKYSQYCNIDVTGGVSNASIAGGNGNYEDMIKDECLEVIGFSDFQMDGVTGDFGGEIRLALYHKDGKAHPVTGGSVTGNIKDVQGTMIMSKQTDITGKFSHPKAVEINGAKLAL